MIHEPMSRLLLNSKNTVPVFVVWNGLSVGYDADTDKCINILYFNYRSYTVREVRDIMFSNHCWRQLYWWFCISLPPTEERKIKNNILKTKEIGNCVIFLLFGLCSTSSELSVLLTDPLWRQREVGSLLVWTVPVKGLTFVCFTSY